MQTRPLRTGPTLSTGKIRRKQKRKKRRLVEANDQDWARWDSAAAAMGLNFAEFARRALSWLTAETLRGAGALALALVLVACGGGTSDPEAAQQQAAQASKTPGCAWSSTPLWNLPAHSVCVQACPGTTLAPLSAGSDGACDLPSYEATGAKYCDDARIWHEPADDVVLWQRDDEIRGVQWGMWDCP